MGRHATTLGTRRELVATVQLQDVLDLPFVHLLHRDNLPSFRAIYFVVYKNEILYIGCTNNLFDRWKAHGLTKKILELREDTVIHWLKYFSKQYFIEEVEKVLIEHFKPRFNKQNSQTGECFLVDEVVDERLSSRGEGQFVDMRQGMKRLTLDIPESLHRTIKQRAADEGVPMAEMLRQDLLEKYKSH